MPLSQVTNVFAGNPLDRVSERRHDPEWVAGQAADPAARAIVLWNGDLLVSGEDGAEILVRLSMDLAGELAPGDEPRLLLGLDGEAALFAIDLDGPSDPTEGPLMGLGRFAGLRDLASRLSGAEAAIAAMARAVFEWRRRHRFCSSCGAPSRPVEAGWKRLCTQCPTEHFPRTDPVVIMLPVAGERCLLGRNVRFREGLFSALAGFVEPGESLEEACARELKEEAGLETLSTVYHSSQPWPFPSSLMVGLIAQVAETEARPDQTELEAVRWFTRAEARALLDGRIEGLIAPPPLAIAHQLLKDWAFG